MGDLIQFPDLNRGPGSYNISLNTLLVTKMFYTVQGEGPHAGAPALFLRLAGCNRGEKERMGCKFCDTDFRFDNGKAMTFVEIEEQLRTLWHHAALNPQDPPLLVITGGEPMMQDNIVPFIEFAQKQDWLNIQIESNGDRLPDAFTENRYCETVDLIVSPKVVGHAYHPLKEIVLARCDVLKFVIDGRPESPYYNLPFYASHKDPGEVYLSPATVYKRAVREGEIASAWDTTLVDHIAMQLNYERAAQLAKRHGFHLSMQQHLFFGVE